MNCSLKAKYESPQEANIFKPVQLGQDKYKEERKKKNTNTNITCDDLQTNVATTITNTKKKTITKTVTNIARQGQIQDTNVTRQGQLQIQIQEQPNTNKHKCYQRISARGGHVETNVAKTNTKKKKRTYTRDKDKNKETNT